MNIRDSNVDSEVVIICHCNIILININHLNLITPICTVEYNTFPFIRSVTFLNTCINELTGDLFYIREVFDWYGIRKKVDFYYYCHISQINILSRFVSDDL